MATNPCSLLDCIAERVRTQPDSAALAGDGERVSYAELGAMALAAHARIEALDLPPGPLAIHADKSARTIALIIGCVLARRTFLLTSADLSDVALDALLTRAGCADVLTAEPVTDLTTWPVHYVDCEPVTTQHAADRGMPADDDISFLLTTTGSGGLPKIVPLTVGSVDRCTDWASTQFDIRPGTVVLNYSPLHSGLTMLDIWATLKAGGTAVLVPPKRSDDGPYLADLVRTHGVEVIQAVPMFYRLLADSYGHTPFVSVRRAIVTRDQIQAALLCELPSLFPRAGIYNLYGCTETNGSFLHEVGAECDRANGLPIGRPLPGVAAVVVDQDGSVLEGAGIGELWVHTPFQTDGYLMATGGQDRFTRLDDGNGAYFRSGDFVRRDANGVCTLVGRDDSHVTVGDTHVNLAEIEDVFLDHGRVAEVAVISLPDEAAGERIHAVVRGTAPGSVDGLSLREFCRLRLPSSSIPTTIRVVDTPLPTTSTGKIDRQAICRDLARPV
ncbi:MAG TPA: AMP-binding protein [Pseudonocardiaceae bacterium]|nr:AMP-binding protein [Pseudonocardiaceae bacterium]